MKIPFRALIVDDESRSRTVLRTLINKNFPDIQIVAEAASAEDAYEMVRKFDPQLVFLDIHMPRADGFSFLKRFENVPFEVIFVTSFDKYAITAIKFSALDYLLKPVEKLELRNAVEKAIDRLNELKGNRTQIVNLLHNMEASPEDHKIAVHTSDSVRVISTSEIVSISANGHYSIIHTDNNDRFTTARDLGDFEEHFGSDSSFIRISKSHIINAKKIVRYTKGEPCMIEMTGGEVFEVARRRKPIVLSKIGFKN